MNLTTESVKLVKSCFLFGEEYETIVNFPSAIDFLIHVIACAVNAILTMAIVFLNSMSVVAYWRSSKLKEKVSYFLIMVLSLVDLGVGTICTPLFTLLLASQITGNTSCRLVFVNRKTTVLVIGLSVATLSAINIETYMNIVHPFVHRRKVTRKRLLIPVILLWIYCIIIVSLSFFEKQAAISLYIAYVLHFPVLTVYVYAKIFFTMKRSRSLLTAPTGNTPTSNDKVLVRGCSELSSKRRFLQDIKLLKSCFLVIICFLLCFLPLSVLLAANINGFNGLVFQTWGTTILMMNSSLNSVILFFRNRMLRNEAKWILNKLTCKS